MNSLVLTIALLAASAGAEAPVEVRLTLDPSEIPLYRSSTLTLTVEAPADLDVTLPDLRGALGGAETFERPQYGSQDLEGGRRRRWVTYVLDPIRTGEYAIEPVRVTWGDGEEITVPGPVLRVRDLTPEEQARIEQFLPILLPAPPRPGLRSYAWGAGAAVLLLAAAGAAWLLWRRRRGPSAASERIRLPWEAALERLDALKARDWTGPEGTDGYYVELSDILRRYIEERFQIHAPEQTTPEFLAEASRAGVFSDEHQRLLAGVLRHSDRVKFARYTPEPADMDRDFNDVRRYVEETTPRPAEEEAA